MPSARRTAAKRAEIVAIATAMIDGTTNLIEGVRRIMALQHDVEDPKNALFMPLRAIESETDHFPIGSMREQCALQYLRQADDEMERYLADARSDILAACLELVSALREEGRGRSG